MERKLEILKLLGLECSLYEGRPVLDYMKYNLSGFLSLDVDRLREKLFYKVYSDMFEFIENILNLDCYTTEYTKQLTDVILEFAFNTILMSSKMSTEQRNHRIGLLSNLSLTDIGDDKASFLIPTGHITIVEHGVIVKYICETKYIDKVKRLFKDSCLDIADENDDYVLFDVFIQDTQRIEIMVNETKRENYVVSIEKGMGLTDGDSIIWHLVIAILNKFSIYLTDLRAFNLDDYYNLGIIKQNIKEER